MAPPLNPSSSSTVAGRDLLESVIDAEIRGNTVVLRLAKGRELSLPATREYLDLYWAVKLRNRRRAFGL